MHTLEVLRDLLVVFSVASGVVFLFHWFRLPSVVGLLVAGVVTGPFGLGLIDNVARVELLAEVGVVVLLFTVGLEFSLSRLAGLGRLMVYIGGPQVLICGLVGLVATWSYFGDARPAVFVGMLLAMSSTAVVFKLLTDRREINAPQGNIAAAVLLFQDLLVVGCMILLPVLAAHAGEAPPWQSLATGTAAVAVMLLAGRYVVPHVLYQVVRTQNRELFLMLLVLLCLGSSALTEAMGWSLALGAFLAGLAISESDYATQTLAEMLPFRDVLASLFFVSVGMLLDLQFFASHPLLVAGTVAAVIVLKFAATALPTLLAGYPSRIAFLAGAALAQVGEFSFILAERGRERGLLDREQFQLFLSAAVLTIAVTPLLIGVAPRIAELIALATESSRRRWPRAQHPVESPAETIPANHVLILGYGHTGRSVARVLRIVDIPYVVLELNPDSVRRARQQDEPLYFGDGTRSSVLHHVGLATARLLVIAISDPASTRRVVQLARQLHPRLHIIVRTRYLTEVEHLRRLGANVVIPEEFETSVEIFARVLREYDVPRNLILDLIDRVRAEHYEVLRDVNLPATRVELPFDIFERMDIDSCLLEADSPAVGRTLAELNLRAATGVTLMAIRRHGELFLNPPAEFRFAPNDIAVLIGDRPQLDRAVCLFGSGDARP